MVVTKDQNLRCFELPFANPDLLNTFLNERKTQKKCFSHQVNQMTTTSYVILKNIKSIRFDLIKTRFISLIRSNSG